MILLILLDPGFKTQASSNIDPPYSRVQKKSTSNKSNASGGATYRDKLASVDEAEKRLSMRFAAQSNMPKMHTAGATSRAKRDSGLTNRDFLKVPESTTP